MEDLIKMDIFFAVTTGSVVIITAFLALLFVRVYSILRNVESISRNVSEESSIIREDIAEVRAALRREGYKMQVLLGSMHLFLQKFFRRRPAK